MPSRFPGMGLYLESYWWADIHQALAHQCQRQLVPLVVPRYTVRLAAIMVTDRVPAHEIGIIFPDVEIIRPHRLTAPLAVATPAAVAIPPAPVSMPLAPYMAAMVRTGHLQVELWPIDLRTPCLCYPYRCILPILTCRLIYNRPSTPLMTRRSMVSRSTMMGHRHRRLLHRT